MAKRKNQPKKRPNEETHKVIEISSRLNPEISETHLKVSKEMLSQVRQLLDQSISVTFRGAIEVEIISEALKALLDKHSNEREYGGMVFMRVPGTSSRWNGFDVPGADKKYRGWIVLNKETGEEIIRDLPRENELEFDEIVEEVKKHIAIDEVLGTIS